ncbi:SGNH/GDSL hydrolase family protein [Streptomyces actuosus]|uniref:SGNH/GDSL hydrolase family protein n=1 Tax=Streptomyces actuosus TaxID=1885 RepID=A0ABS2VZY6_STRAS|nr:SGNH/GDSL hydrolase family protein [Streptomyces actuosus]MBN0048589.1 SGNH/GDSL hydrolase family protein [Streptomyces actuosus]
MLLGLITLPTVSEPAQAAQRPPPSSPRGSHPVLHHHGGRRTAARPDRTPRRRTEDRPEPAGFPGAVALSCLLAVVPASAASAVPESAGGRNYVALGDSYASAPGVPEPTDPGCGRSSQNYPSLVARQRYAHLTDVTCAGATTASLALGTDGRPAQYDALRRDTDLVTVSIGGNDRVGFSAVLKTCATLSRTDPTGAPCRGHYTEGGRERLLEGIATTAPKVDAVLATIHRRAPHAKVLLVGYPPVFDDDGTGCTSPAAPFAAGDFGYRAASTGRARAGPCRPPWRSAHVPGRGTALRG